MTALLKQHEQEIAALETSFEAEEARDIAEITKKLNESHMQNVQQVHKELLDKVSLKIKQVLKHKHWLSSQTGYLLLFCIFVIFSRLNWIILFFFIFFILVFVSHRPQKTIWTRFSNNRLWISSGRRTKRC